METHLSHMTLNSKEKTPLSSQKHKHSPLNFIENLKISLLFCVKLLMETRLSLSLISDPVYCSRASPHPITVQLQCSLQVLFQVQLSYGSGRSSEPLQPGEQI